MDIDGISPSRYRESGFEIMQIGETSDSGHRAFILNYRQKTVFIFSSDQAFSLDFFQKLCQSYLQQKYPAAEKVAAAR
jgi:hypothetical protein